MTDPIAMLQSVLDPEMPLSERAAIKAAIDEIERLRREVTHYRTLYTDLLKIYNDEAAWIRREEADRG